MVLSATEIYLRLLRDNQSICHKLHVLGISWPALASSSTKECYSCLVLGFILGGLWLLVGAMSVETKSSLNKYMCVCILLNIIKFISFWKSIVNSMIPCGLTRKPYFNFLKLIILSIYIPDVVPSPGWSPTSGHLPSLGSQVSTGLRVFLSFVFSSLALQ